MDVLIADPVQPGALFPAIPVSGRSHQQPPDLTLAPDLSQRPALEFFRLLDPDLVRQNLQIYQLQKQKPAF